MKKIFVIFNLILILACCTNLNYQDNERIIIAKENGDIILAYKGFNKFLNSEKNWNSYKKYVLDEFPTLMSIHQRYIQYGLIDSILFQKQISDYSMEEFKPYFNNITEEQVINIYDSVIIRMDNILSPLNKVDVCFFLPYGKDCYVQDVYGRKTVFISIKYDIEEMVLILIHEYAHCLHHQRRPREPSVLKKWIISEGIASIFPILLSENYSIYDGLWMMPIENVDWCIQNEHQIIDSILVDLDKKGDVISKKYIAGGEGFAKPPKGFPEKTAYYIGYRIIEKCLYNGISLSEICNMNSKSIIDTSGLLKI